MCERREQSEQGRTDENGSDVGGENTVAGVGDVLDEEAEDGFEGQVMAVGEGDGKAVAVNQLVEEGKGRGGGDVLIQTRGLAQATGGRAESKLTLRRTESRASPYLKSFNRRSHSISFFFRSLPTLCSPSNAFIPSIASLPLCTIPPEPAPASSAS